jgi:molybdopterin synthase catalytic subunit
VNVVRLIAIRETELSLDEVRAAVAGPGAGGIALFAGAVRDSNHGQGVTGLSYSAHPLAEAELRRIAEMVAEKFKVLGIAAVHRVGDLAVGDLAVVIAVSCAHRGEAFDACRELIDVLKASVPIWKHQLFADGTSEWVGTP